MRFSLSVVSVLTALATAVSGQATSAYTDPATGIQYQRFHTSGNGGFSFGITFPQNPTATSEFIGQIVGPINSGYSGISLGGGMVGNLLLIAWAQGTAIRSSFRYVDGYTNPVIYTATNPTATTLHTSFNSTHFSWTFRCQNCAKWTGGSGGFDPTAEFAIMGWAQASSGTTSPSNNNSPIAQHNNGFGQYGVVLPQARFAQYSQWITIGTSSTRTSTTTTSSSTSTTTTTTSTTTVPGFTGTPVPTAETYDYIVVGGGPGGIVAADRLSEAGKKVLLIERGPPSTWATGGRNGPSWTTANQLTRYDVPGLCNQIWVDSVGIACPDIGTMAGCVLGGGTAINAGLFFKPPAADWDSAWPTGWKSGDMSAATNKVFSRIPSTDTPSMDGQRYIQESYTLMSNILSGSGWRAVTANNVPNDKNRTFAHTPFMYSGGQRGGPLATYYATARARSNVRVVLNTMVERVVRSGGRITGVEVVPTAASGFRGTWRLATNGRVVLSAGAFGTAKILFRSGIGPADQLATVAAAEPTKMIAQSSWILLPVGYNLMDHNNIDVVFSHNSVVPYDFYAAWDNPIAADRTKYLSNRAGPLAGSAPAPNTMAWEQVRGPDGITRSLQWTIRVEGSLGASGDKLLTLSQYLGTGHTSRGRLGITSSLTTTVIDPPYLKNENDIAVTIKGVDSLISAAKKISGITFLYPTASQTAEQYVRSYAGGRGSNHWMGSCKLGTDDGRNFQGKSGSVVDLNTKVYGTDNLFIVDASIFPGHTTTNPSAPIMVAAEKAVEKILALSNGAPVARYGQCGGVEYTGSTVCVSGTTCTYLNDYYWQCL